MKPQILFLLLFSFAVGCSEAREDKYLRLQKELAMKQLELDSIPELQEKLLIRMVGTPPEWKPIFDQIEIANFGSYKADIAWELELNHGGLLDGLKDSDQEIPHDDIKDAISDAVDRWRYGIPDLQRPSLDYATEVKEKLFQLLISYKNKIQAYSDRLEKYQQNRSSEWYELEVKAESLRLEIDELSMVIVAMERT